HLIETVVCSRRRSAMAILRGSPLECATSWLSAQFKRLSSSAMIRSAFGSVWIAEPLAVNTRNRPLHRSLASSLRGLGGGIVYGFWRVPQKTREQRRPTPEAVAHRTDKTEAQPRKKRLS